MVDNAMPARAGRAARTRARRQPEPLVPGSDAHKCAFCHMLLDTHDPYRPAVIAWPRLDPATRARVVGLPIWDIAVQTEGKARLRVLAYAGTVADPLLRRAIELDAFEEGRHKEVLANLVSAYAIALAPEPEYRRPRDPEWAFMVTGFSECIDSVFAFGLFALAQQSGFFPRELVDTFEPIMQEEGRHILFFVNWVAWHRRNLPLWRRLLFDGKILAVWAFLAWERVGIARAMPAGAADNNFTLTGSRAIGADRLSARELINLCLAENERRLSLYDPRLLRPRTVPRLLRFMRFWVRKEAVAPPP
ncbi:MAG: hypothetical protein ACREE4_01885 [Stellaceae bacterium]